MEKLFDKFSFSYSRNEVCLENKKSCKKIYLTPDFRNENYVIFNFKCQFHLFLSNEETNEFLQSSSTIEDCMKYVESDEDIESERLENDRSFYESQI